MRLILHIFRKDAIRLWPLASVFLALLALHGFMDRKYAPYGPPDPLSALPSLLPIACGILLVALVHQEGLVGEREYWLSRPLPRRQLLAAKVLFVLVFVNLPLFVYQAATIISAGLPLSRNLLNLLCLQVFFTAVDILPVAALAAVTKNMVQTVLAALAAAAVIGAMSSIDWADQINPASGINWIESTVSAAILLSLSAVVMLVQYSRRAANVTRPILAAALALAALAYILPFAWEWPIQMRLSPQQVDPAAVRIAWNPANRHALPPDSRTNSPDFVRLDIPIEIDNVPLDTSVNIEAIQPIAETPAGDAWRPRWMREDVNYAVDGPYFNIYMDRNFFQRVKDTPLRFHGVMSLTLLRKVRTLPLILSGRVDVPGIGNCASYPPAPGAQLRGPVISCNSVQPSARLVLVERGRRFPGYQPDFAPYPASAGYSPLGPMLWQFATNALSSDTHLELQKPIAYLQRAFDFEGIRLADYAMESFSHR
jgi:hypothetical protein